MANPTPANAEITDAVTQANVSVLAEAPAMAMATLYQTMAHSLGISMENATARQHNLAITAQAATTQGVMQIYRINAGSDHSSALLNAQSGSTKSKDK